MIEELKQLIQLIADLPEMALWILFGFAVYKTFVFSSVTGSLYYGFKYLVEKVHDGYMNKRRVREVSIDGRFITSDGTYTKFLALIDEMVNLRTRISTNYVHADDVEWLREAIKEKRLRDKKQQEERK